MGDRFRAGFIALTAVVVALAIASAIFSHATPAPLHSYAPYAPSATPSPSPRRIPTLRPPTTTVVATPTPEATDTLSPSPTFISYVVKPGQTLGSIAGEFGVTLQALLAANPEITDARRIFDGEIILIPPPGWEPSPSSSSSPNPSHS